jgi:hypothetical protein
MSNANHATVMAFASILIGLSVTATSAQSRSQRESAVVAAQYSNGWELRRDDTSDPGSAPLASPTGGRPVLVDPTQVRRENTADPGSAPLASPTGGRPVPVAPEQVLCDDTRDPG